MTRTTFSLEEALLEKLRVIAAKRGVSLATVIRESLERTTRETFPRATFLGIVESGNTDSVADLGRELGEPRTWRS